MRIRPLELPRAWPVCALLVACGSAQPLSAGDGEGGSSAIGGSASGSPSTSGVSSGGTVSGGESHGGTPATAGGAGGAASTLGGAASSTAGSGGRVEPGVGGSSTVAGSGGSLLGNAGSATAGAGGSSVNQADLPAITLHLAGDSTVMDYGADSAQEGWGQELGQFFISKLTIDNRALGGASIETFQSRWTGITASLKAGDFAMSDFGINDSGTVEGRSVTTADFQKTLSQMNQQTKAKQATFIIVTPSALQYWSGGMETNARLAPYVAVENALGMSDGIPIDDLNAQSLTFLNMIGQTAAKDIYINGDKAHFTKQGATQMAKFVAAELARIKSPLAAYLK